MSHFPPRTVVITYKDGDVLKVPYITQEGLDAFLALENDIVDVRITTYKGE
jgi:hypothetical protein